MVGPKGLIKPPMIHIMPPKTTPENSSRPAKGALQALLQLVPSGENQTSFERELSCMRPPMTQILPLKDSEAPIQRLPKPTLFLALPHVNRETVLDEEEEADDEEETEEDDELTELEDTDEDDTLEELEDTDEDDEEEETEELLDGTAILAREQELNIMIKRKFRQMTVVIATNTKV